MYLARKINRFYMDINLSRKVNQMRTLKDRIRHTVMFEGIALTLLAVFGAWITGHAPTELGVLGLMMSLIAMSWNLVYNWMFDQWDNRVRDMAPRGVGLRIVHALLFEGGLLIVGLFVIAWWLSMTYWDAFMLDIGLSVFFLAYAFVFNWAYDVVFPVPRRAADIADGVSC